ncbi:MAG: ribosome maturation factor RimP [Nitriliruptor sp.]|uniref:ribosome maturation factor RimP n=1 Tax=Nitriliruptor sp. TaxID=2448056 RepID=UPI0034A0505A
MARPDDTTLPARVRELALPLAEELEVDLVDVEVKGQQGRRVVKLVADAIGPGDGLDVDTIAMLSRKVGNVLDETDLVPGAYTLEVTSPGATRPLRRPRDFTRNTGREVDVIRREELGDPRTLRGEVTGADDDAVTLETADGPVRVPLADIDHGKVVLPW